MENTKLSAGIVSSASQRWVSLVGLLAAASTQSCMSSPADGQRVRDRDATFNLSGFHTHSSAPVRVLAYNFQLARYDEVGSATSRSTPVPEQWWDDPLYEWDAGSRTLGLAYWQPGRCTGYRALLKGQTTVGGNTYGMYSWDLAKNGEGCTNEHTNNADWVQHCSANESNVYTVDHTDAPRPFTWNVSGLNPNATCTDLELSFRHAATWDAVQGTYRSGSTSRSLSCSSDPPTATGTVFGHCRMNLGSMSAVRSVIEARRTTSATATLSARDLGCRERLRSSASNTLGSSSFDFNWSRWSGTFPQCSAPPPPPAPPPAPRTHTVLCACTDETGAATATLNACIDTVGGSSAVVTGAALLCGFAERDIEFVSGYDTTCRMLSVSGAGATCPRAGDYSITRLDPR